MNNHADKPVLTSLDLFCTVENIEKSPINREGRTCQIRERVGGTGSFEEISFTVRKGRGFSFGRIGWMVFDL